MDLKLELDLKEATDLRDALQTYISESQNEIVHTDDLEYRRQLQAEQDRLKGVLARLDRAISSEKVSAA